MVFAGKLKKKSVGGGGGGEGWGMDIFLVFFPEEEDHKQNLSSSTTSSSSSLSIIFKKAQSTISICALLIFSTLLLFTLSTIQPNNNNFISSPHSISHTTSPKSNPRALQGLGTLYTRGTTPMNNLLLLCHVTDSLTTKQLQIFLRTFHRSGLPSNSDLVFIFPTLSTPESFDNVILEENNFFLRIINQYKAQLSNDTKVSDFPASFDPTRFVKSGKKVREKGEPIWGGKMKTTRNNDTESARMSYGSVVGFGVGELDPENALSGFVDKIPMSLRRWASYPMLLGRVRRSYKHVMLVDVNKVLLLGDPLARLKNLTPDSVFFSRHQSHHHHKTINPAVIMGGVRGIRRLSAAMLTEIVRATTSQPNKRKNSVTESGMLNRLAMNEFTLKSIRVVMTSAESIRETRPLGELGMVNRTILLWRENRDTDVESLIIMKHICSFPVDSTVYTDC